MQYLCLGDPEMDGRWYQRVSYIENVSVPVRERSRRPSLQVMSIVIHKLFLVLALQYHRSRSVEEMVVVVAQRAFGA